MSYEGKKCCDTLNENRKGSWFIDFLLAEGGVGVGRRSRTRWASDDASGQSHKVRRQSGGEDGCYDTRLHSGAGGAARSHDSQLITRLTHSLAAFVLFSLHAPQAMQYINCPLFCCSCRRNATLESYVSNVAHPDRKCNFLVIRQYMQSLYHPVRPAQCYMRKNPNIIMAVLCYLSTWAEILPNLACSLYCRPCTCCKPSQQPLMWDFSFITAAGDGEAGERASGGGAKRKARKSRCCQADKTLMIDGSQF